MCEPVSIIMAVTAVVGLIQAEKMADKQEQAVAREQAAEAAATAVQQTQINQQASIKMSDRAREAMIERGRLRAAAAESGVTGLSNDKLESASFFAEGTDISRIEGNRARAIVQSEHAHGSRNAANQSKMDSIKQPSYLGAGLQIANAGMTGYQRNPGFFKSLTSSSAPAESIYPA